MKPNANATAFSNVDAFKAAFSDLMQLEQQKADKAAKLQAKITALQAKHSEETASLNGSIEALRQSIGQYAHIHRDTLTGGGLRKSVSIGNGAIKWRKQPDSVQITGDLDTMLAELKKRRLTRFLRVKTELNKTAIMADAELLKKRPIAGITIVQGGESMVIDTGVKA
ncbi:host-nuclease inhibitor Gam family protein [Vitreoscilla massiliensis]|uniref:Host-nuclease inhibitor Gam family protein n=1 Tax=Vitreoscilla massiliensis TaxID=1689272 RepID=A0ABY4DXM2_9NEIS|nr:host-nuclease inhibitor Gam family protein [Vitreoscilla massiliensis]UOO87846.1 host-nuclease inhibitor Gam family protein [Vitreoscilla massiliensis]